MNVVASYLLLKLAGKDPKAADITALISSTGGEADEAKVELFMKEMEGKDVEELLKEGKDKLKSVSMGGGGGGGGGAAPAAVAAGAAPAAVKVRAWEGMQEKRRAHVAHLVFATLSSCLLLLSSSYILYLFLSLYIKSQEEKEEEADLGGAMDMFGVSERAVNG